MTLSVYPQCMKRSQIDEAVVWHGKREWGGKRSWGQSAAAYEH